MLECEGFRMFHGTATVTPAVSSPLKPFDLSGTWLYKPDTDCWYCAGRSFPAEIVGYIREED